MTNYAILSWSPTRSVAETLAAARQCLHKLGWTKLDGRAGLEIWGPSVPPPAIFISPSSDAVVVGRVFGAIGTAWRGDAEASARALCQTLWGRYIAVFRNGGGEASHFFRDPSGAVEAISWRSGGLVIVASDVPELLKATAPANLAIDWSRLGAGLANRIALANATPLIGVSTVSPGALRNVVTGQETSVWAPGKFAARALSDTPEARSGLVETIDRTVSSLAHPSGVAIAELSGGLDSSIVASALVRAPIKIAQWVHYFVTDAGGDERAYARATARHLGVTITEVPKQSRGLWLKAHVETSQAIRPSGASADAFYDQDLAARCRDLGARQIFSGLGGDTVFMQGGNPLQAADDYWRSSPWRLKPALDVARYAKRSVWSVWRGAQRARLNPDPKPYQVAVGHLTPRVTNGPPPEPHPWLTDCQDVPPAKRRQIFNLTYQMLVRGVSARGMEAEIVNPLLAQPVMEFCLMLSTRALTRGGDDRVMARSSFEDRLAPEVFARRSKGDLGPHYGRSIAEDLEAVRDLLVDGELVGAGLVNPEALEEVLTPETLIWRGPYREIHDMITLELWARSWRRRLGGVGPVDPLQRAVEPA
jgi:asparagine synthase (glutamine-hydrolysing)